MCWRWVSLRRADEGGGLRFVRAGGKTSPGMDAKLGMKVLGGRKPRPYWDRFHRLQTRADLLLGDARGPKGVFRFLSHEDYEQWKMTFRLKNRPASQSRTI